MNVLIFIVFGTDIPVSKVQTLIRPCILQSALFAYVPKMGFQSKKGSSLALFSAKATLQPESCLPLKHIASLCASSGLEDYFGMLTL